MSTLSSLLDVTFAPSAFAPSSGAGVPSGTLRSFVSLHFRLGFSSTSLHGSVIYLVGKENIS